MGGLLSDCHQRHTRTRIRRARRHQAKKWGKDEVQERNKWEYIVNCSSDEEEEEDADDSSSSGGDGTTTDSDCCDCDKEFDNSSDGDGDENDDEDEHYAYLPGGGGPFRRKCGGECTKKKKKSHSMEDLIYYS